MIHSCVILLHQNVDYSYTIGPQGLLFYLLAFYIHLLFSQHVRCFFCFPLSVLSSISLIFSSIVFCDASILSCTSLTSYANLINFSLLMVISDDNLSILWLVTNDAEFTVSIRTFSCCWSISWKIELMLSMVMMSFESINGYDVIRIISHLNCLTFL